MSGRYDIASYFSLEAKRQAARSLYLPNDEGHLRDIYAFCPLGIMLRADGATDTEPAPIEWDAQDWLGRRVTLEVIESFISAWDDGLIPNLYEALGITRQGVPS